MEGVQKWISNRFTLLKLIFQHWRQEVKSDPLSDQLESEKKSWDLELHTVGQLAQTNSFGVGFFYVKL